MSHWVTTTTPYFFEPMRTAATFKMLPDPAFVVSWACFVCHSCPWHSAVSPASAVSSVYFWSPNNLISAASRAGFCLHESTMQAMPSRRQCCCGGNAAVGDNTIMVAMLLCTGPRLHISCNLLLTCTVRCLATCWSVASKCLSGNRVLSELHSLFTTSQWRHICSKSGQSRSHSIGSNEDNIRM